jgi:NADPH:quinone reductase-like Zn-dependent oxidoreductase
MKQVWIPRRGGPEVLEVRDAPEPACGDGELLVDVAAAGINFADIMARMGLYPDAPPLPCVVGYEVAGTVRAVGRGIDDIRPGQRVVGLTRFGGYASVVAGPLEHFVPLPDTINFETAAAIPVNYLTAWLMLHRQAAVREGDHVLVHSAAGGVGQAAMQICKRAGAKVVASASEGKHARLFDAGAIACINSRDNDVVARVREATAGRGVDVVLDPIGGASFQRSYACLAPMGRLCMFGASSFAPGTRRSIAAVLAGVLKMRRFSPVSLMNDNRGVFGLNLGHLWEEAAVIRAIFQEIVDLVHDGIFAPVVDRAYAFDEAGEAHAYIQSRASFGKVVLRPTLPS